MTGPEAQAAAAQQRADCSDHMEQTDERGFCAECGWDWHGDEHFHPDGPPPPRTAARPQRDAQQGSIHDWMARNRQAGETVGEFLVRMHREAHGEPCDCGWHPLTELPAVLPR